MAAYAGSMRSAPGGQTDVYLSGETAASAARATSHAARLDLNLLRTFLAVYRAGSFTAAAGLVGLSQPTVTAQIRTLEHHTGHELFVRLPRGVQPTASAHELAARIADPLEALEGRASADDPATTQAPVHLAGPSELPWVQGVVATLTG
jgi:DNA-binding transcriptional LysR family regulator